VRQEVNRTGHRFRNVVHRAKALADKDRLKPETYVLKGHPVRDILHLADQLKVDLLVVGATGHSSVYERLIRSRADRLVQLAPCPVLVVK
jgi:nucleotide-binding universal stress UspA family protein